MESKHTDQDAKNPGEVPQSDAESGRLGRFVELAATLTNASGAFISIVEGNRIRYRQSLGVDLDSAPLDHTICSRVVDCDHLQYAADSKNDPRFEELELVREMQVGLYAGVPIHSCDGTAVGVLGVCSAEVIELSDDQLHSLESLGVCVSETLAMDASGSCSSIRDTQGKTVCEVLSEPSSYEQIFRNSADPMVITDLSGKLMDANRAGLELFERNLVDIRSLHLIDFVCEGEHAKVQELLEQDGASACVSTRTLFRRSNGHEFPVDIVSNAFDLGKKTVLHHTIRDVSDKVEAAKALEDAQIRILQSQKLEAIGQLSAGIAHDFNNMLAIIQTYSEFAVNSLEESNPARDDMHEVLNAAEKSAELVAKLLVFARDPKDKVCVVKVDEAVEEAVAILERTLEKKIELNTRLAAGDARIEMEQSDLEQILMNLVINARDAVDGDGGIVQISTMSKDGEVFLIVHDNGPGMSPELCDKIFEPFFTTKAEGHGTGLGLPTVESLVHRAGGRVDLDSVEGVGTSFRIRLPLEAALDEVTEIQLEEVTTVDRFERILLAEDEAPLRHAISRVLQEQGFDVRDAPNGEVAAQILGEWECDLLISDVKMPKMNGLDLAALARFMGYDGPIMLISAHMSDAEYGDHHVMQKPFVPAELVEEIRRLQG